MRRPGLTLILTAINLALVLAAVLAVARAAVVRLERLADEQALARVEMAAAGARLAIDRVGGETLTAARLLAERPHLEALIRGGDAAGAAAFLERFRRTGGLDGCVVLLDGRVFATGGATFEWLAIARDAERGYGIRRAADGSPVLAAAATGRGRTRSVVFAAARRLDAAVERDIGEQIGHEVRLLTADEARRDPEGPRAEVRARSLDSEGPARARLEDGGLYVAELPLRALSGEMIGLVETSLPRQGTLAGVRRLRRSLFVIAAAVGLLAALGSLLVARRLVRPLELLTGAAERIGAGDLATPIPRAAGFEVGTLAGTMEGMRDRLLRLTGTLRQRQVEAETILAGIVEGVFAVDRERRILYLNPQAAALLGIDAAAALGRFCGDVLDPRGADGVRPCDEHCPIIQARFRGGASATEHLMLQDGARRTVVITSSPVEPGGPPTEGIRQFQVLRDETEAEATRRLRDAVLANISHEFRTPLTAQLASIELLRDRFQEGDAAGAATLVESLERGTLRLTQLIDNLLESVRIEAGRDSIRRRSVALDEVVEEALAMTGPLIAQRSQVLHADLPYPLPPVLGDAPRLTQVFVNLLANANKFAPAGSTIGIGGSVGDREITLWVEDEGPGFPGGDGPRRFEAFSRTPDPGADDEPEQGGMGLGLWIVKSIVERHGGRIEVRPARAAAALAANDAAADGVVGRAGTRLCVILPVERSAAP